ncbi:MAG TPA: AAA family ATPase, partial [Methanothrix soehngenii]|nr:AAA family ATPase [Methanothrix soehngenii]
MSYERPLKSVILAELSRPAPVIHVIIGPRQVGKTTIARQIQDSIGIPTIYATADSPIPLDAGWVEASWRRAIAEGAAQGFPVLLILDELQKVKGWSESLKLLWDNRSPDQDIRVLILGSSALLMQEGLTESLAGRFFLHRCTHWGYPECRYAFGWALEQWIYFGGYPGASVFMENEANWKSYINDSLIETVLARDVLQMSRITKPALLRHLFALSATLPAHVISYNKMLGQLQDAGNTTTLAHYLKMLENAFLVSGLELFSKGRLRKKGSSPKLVLWNNALVNSYLAYLTGEKVG